LFSIIFWLLGSESWNRTEEYLEKEGGPSNAELARDVLPYARTTLQVWLIGRMLLFIVSFKWPQLIKYLIYVDLF